MAHINRLEIRPRSITPQPSRELGLLMQTLGRDVLSSNSIGLCYNAGINFIGSMLLATLNEKYVNMIRNAGFQPARDVIEPIKITRGLELMETEMKTGSVVIKQACGAYLSGLLTDGPLAGLITGELGKTPELENTVFPIRLFNDELIPKNPRKYHPYYPYFFVGQPFDADLESIEDKKVKKLVHKLKSQFFGDYKIYIDNLRQNLGNPKKLYTSQVVLSLCKNIGVNVDTDRFHVTRP